MSHATKDGGDEEGLLEEILTLVAPPVSEEALKKEREEKKVQRRRERDQAAAGMREGKVVSENIFVKGRVDNLVKLPLFKCPLGLINSPQEARKVT